MGDVSPFLREFRGPQGSCEVGQQLQTGNGDGREGKEQLAFVLLCFVLITSVLKRETQDVDGNGSIAKRGSVMSICAYTYVGAVGNTWHSFPDLSLNRSFASFCIHFFENFFVFATSV